jgi:hypothetical protein
MAARARSQTTSRRASQRKRAGKGAKRLLRADKVAAARRHWKQLLIAYLALWAALLSFVVAFPQPAFSKGLAVGVGLGTMPMLWREFLIGRGIATREMGVIAEEWTAAELAKLDSRCWFVLHDLPGPHGNVDHVAIGPNRIHVIETKWTSAAGKLHYLKDAARQAEANAQAIRTHLAAQGVVDREVLPILIVWGSGAAENAKDPYLEGGTTVLMGAHAKVWRERMQQADKGAPDRVALEAVASPLPSLNGTWTSGSAPTAVDPREVVINGARDIQVAPWKRYGKHRLYANVPGLEESVGWIDVPSGQLYVAEGAPDNTARDLKRARDRLSIGPESETDGGRTKAGRA